MGIFDRLFGRRKRQEDEVQQWRQRLAEPNVPAYPVGQGAARPGYGQVGQQSAAPQGRPLSPDEEAVARYRYMLRTAPPDTIEQAHAEAFARLTPEQRQLVLRELATVTPEHERAWQGNATPDPQMLAQMATRAEVRQPGTLERLFGGVGMGGARLAPGGFGLGGGGMGGGMFGGMGGMLGGSLLTSIAGSFIGTMIAEELFGPRHFGGIGGFGPFDAAGAYGDTGGEPFGGFDGENAFAGNQADQGSAGDPGAFSGVEDLPPGMHDSGGDPGQDTSFDTSFDASQDVGGGDFGGADFGGGDFGGDASAGW